MYLGRKENISFFIKRLFFNINASHVSKAETRQVSSEIRDTTLAMQRFDSLLELLPNMEHYHEEFQQLYATPKGLQKMKNPVGRQEFLKHIPFLMIPG